MLQLSKVQNHFNRYLQVGGFLNWPWPTTTFWAQQVMREDVVDKVLKRDLPSFTKSATQQSWSASSCISAMFSSEIVSIEAIAKELNGGFQTNR